ncbi:hypothetical protein ES708_30815 [subsurface metagenome]
MLGAQQVRPGQLTAVPATVAPTQLGGIGELLEAIMPLIIIMMVFMMLTPMLKGMAAGFGPEKA